MRVTPDALTIFPEERRFILIAGRGYERRDHVAISVTKGDDLVTFDVFVAAEPNVIASGFFAPPSSCQSPWMIEMLRRLA